MGAVTVGAAQEDIDGRTARTADVGNPHLVLVGPGVAGVARVEIETRGPQLQAAYPDGINVEWIEVAHDADGDFLELRVWERGAGETLACGTGSVAAAAVARALKLVGGSGPVRVHNPGGMLEVTLGPGAEAEAEAPPYWPGRCARWPISSSTRGCCLERRAAGDADRPVVSRTHHPGRRGLPGQHPRGGRRGHGRAGPTGGQCRGRRGGPGGPAPGRVPTRPPSSGGARRRRSPS